MSRKALLWCQNFLLNVGLLARGRLWTWIMVTIEALILVRLRSYWSFEYVGAKRFNDLFGCPSMLSKPKLLAVQKCTLVPFRWRPTSKDFCRNQPKKSGLPTKKRFCEFCGLTSLPSTKTNMSPSKLTFESMISFSHSVGCLIVPSRVTLSLSWTWFLLIIKQLPLDNEFSHPDISTNLYPHLISIEPMIPHRISQERFNIFY